MSETLDLQTLQFHEPRLVPVEVRNGAGSVLAARNMPPCYMRFSALADGAQIVEIYSHPAKTRDAFERFIVLGPGHEVRLGRPLDGEW